MRSILQVLADLFNGRKSAVIPPTRNNSDSSAGNIGAGSAVFFAVSGTEPQAGNVI